VAEFGITYDPSQPAGSRLAPEVVEEIVLVAPSTVAPGSITEPKMADNAIQRRAIADDAVGTDEIGAKEVKTANIDDGAVGGTQIADGGVGPEQVGAGVPTVVDSGNNPITAVHKKLTAAEYAGITTPDPNTWYFIT
jgi:hypothetical protein